MQINIRKIAFSVLKYALNSDFIIYLFRCMIGFVVGFYLVERFPQYELNWALISIILVISPEEADSKKLAIDRFFANLIGSLAGLVGFWLDFNLFAKVFVGMLVSVLICRLFNLMSVVRSSLVALIIIVVPQPGQVHHWTDAVERFVFVAIGCLIGLIITICTSFLIAKGKNYYKFARDQINKKLN